MHNSLMTHPAILLATGNSVINQNQEHSKNIIIKVFEDTASWISDPSSITRDTVWDYMEITGGDTQLLTTILTTLKPIAFALVVVFMLVNLMNQYAAMGNQMSLIILTKVFLYTAVAIVALDYIGAIVSQFCTLQNAFAESVQSAISGSTLENPGADGISAVTKVEAVRQAIVGFDYANVGTLLQSVELVILSVVGWVVNAIAMLITSVVVFSAKLEMMIKFAFTPFALAGMCSDDHRSQAIHYLRKCLAASFYCGAIMILMYIANSIPANNAINAMYEALQATDAAVSGTGGVASAGMEAIGGVAVFANSWILTIIGPFSAIGAISTVKSTINEALGA